jgi:hypothetical protein
MNDLSAFDGDGGRDRQICDLRIRGKSEAEVMAMLGCTLRDIHSALDKAAAAAMTPQARVRDIWLDKSRLEQYEQALVTAALAGDEKAIATAVRVQERKATLMGSNAPQRIDPVALALEAGPRPSSTERLRKVFAGLAEDQQALGNGGSDDRDREDEPLDER